MGKRPRPASAPSGKRAGSSGASSAVLAAAAVAALAAGGGLIILGLRRSAALGPCQRLDASTLTASRFNDLVRSGQPAVLVGADGIPELRTAARRWRERDYLLQKYGDVRLQVSLSASEEFEGVEPTVNWAGAERFWQAWRGKEPAADVEALSAAGSRFRGCEAQSERCVRHIYDRASAHAS